MTIGFCPWWSSCCNPPPANKVDELAGVASRAFTTSSNCLRFHYGVRSDLHRGAIQQSIGTYAIFVKVLKRRQTVLSQAGHNARIISWKTMLFALNRILFIALFLCGTIHFRYHQYKHQHQREGASPFSRVEFKAFLKKNLGDSGAFVDGI